MLKKHQKILNGVNKNTLVVAGVTLVIVVVVAGFFLTRGPSYQKESITVEQDLTPIELTEEEQQALKDEGLTIPSGEDALAEDLQSVRISDELDAIEADLNETDLTGLDAELDAIESNLFGL